jgi:pentose-5-phosphate-3-epimerase
MRRQHGNTPESKINLRNRLIDLKKINGTSEKPFDIDGTMDKDGFYTVFTMDGEKEGEEFYTKMNREEALEFTAKAVIAAGGKKNDPSCIVIEAITQILVMGACVFTHDELRAEINRIAEEEGDG